MSITRIRGNTQIMPNTISDGQVDSTIIVAAGTNAFSANQSMGGFKLTNLATPTSSGDAVPKTYVDGLVTGLKWKNSVIAATTANGTLATAYENGDTVDGVTLTTGDRILLKNQTSGDENGIYIVAASGAPARASDADSGAELVNAAVFVEQGTVNADKAFVCNNNSITLGVTSIVFVTFASTIGALQASNNLSDVASAATSRTNLGATTVGGNVFTVTNPSAITFLRVNADNTVTLLDASSFRTAIGVTGGTNVIRETPSGTVNGSNVTFTLAHTPTSGTEHLYLNGLLQEAGGEDYSISSATITFTTAPVSGDRIRASYTY